MPVIILRIYNHESETRNFKVSTSHKAFEFQEILLPYDNRLVMHLSWKNNNHLGEYASSPQFI